MVILLPNRSTDFAGFATGLSGAGFAGILGQMRLAHGDVGIPRLHVEYSADLVAPLSALGMAPAFQPHVADFRALFPSGGVYISRVKHKTYLDSNEEGTEAAAATAVVMSRAVRIPTNNFKMQVDHPFVLALRDTSSGAILFLGAIVDPGQG
jgi:serpin B